MSVLFCITLHDSLYFHRLQGIEIKSPVPWPYNKGLSFCCWLRVESFPEKGMMGLFSFFTENGKGCLAMLGKNTLIYEVIFASDLRSFRVLFCQCSFSFMYVLSSVKRISLALKQLLSIVIRTDLWSDRKNREPETPPVRSV